MGLSCQLWATSNAARHSSLSHLCNVMSCCQCDLSKPSSSERSYLSLLLAVGSGGLCGADSHQAADRGGDGRTQWQQERHAQKQGNGDRHLSLIVLTAHSVLPATIVMAQSQCCLLLQLSAAAVVQPAAAMVQQLLVQWCLLLWSDDTLGCGCG